jgi:tripartite-type tricarboxylate transporter receptor subunit TctC
MATPISDSRLLWLRKRARETIALRERKPAVKVVIPIVAAAAVVGALPQISVCQAETFPARPIAMVVPFPPAGAVDITARIVAERMGSALGQPVVIENVSGAGGTIGVTRAARAPADGYTLSVGDWTSHVASQIIYPVHYDALKDFRPITLLTTSPQLIVGRSDLPFNDLNELIASLKTNPESMSAATVGAGSNPHMCGISLQQKTGIRLRFVPYRGGAPATQDLLAGHVDLMCAEGTNVLEYLRSGRLKAFAVLSQTRWAAAPDVPTIDEVGLARFYIVQWRGLWAPKDTPDGVIDKIHAAAIAALRDPQTRNRAAAIGQEVVPAAQQTPEALGALQAAEIAKWGPLIKAAGIKVE